MRKQDTISRKRMEQILKEEVTAFKATLEQKATDKTNAKAKLMAGEALTQAEADTLII